MRPHVQTHTRSSGLARARMLLKSKLGWLEGYPDGARWVVVHHMGDLETEALTLDRNHLRRATYTARKLRGEFPRAMPALVGDVEAWYAAVEQVLGSLKPWVHRDEPPPRDLLSTDLYSRSARARARGLLREHSDLTPLVSAASWVLATRASSAGKAFGWLEREASSLAELCRSRPADEAIPLALRCLHLSLRVGPRAVAPLARILGEPAVFDAPTHGDDEYLGQVKIKAQGGGLSRIKPPLPPRPLMGHALQTLVGQLLSQDRPRAKRILSLLDLLGLEELAAEWGRWWPPAIRAAQAAYRVYEHERDPIRRQRRQEELRRRVVQMEEDSPPALDPRPLVDALLSATSDAFSDSFDAARRALGRVQVGTPRRAAFRGGMLVRWVKLRTTDRSWWETKRVPVLLRAWGRFLRDAEPADDLALVPWYADALRTAGSGRWSSGVDDDLLDEDLEPRDIERFFEALEWRREHEPDLPREELAACLIRLLEAFHDAELAARLSVAMQCASRHDHWYDADVLVAAWAAARPDHDAFPPLVEALESIGESTELPPPALIAVLRPALRDDQVLLRAMLLDDDRGDLIRCGRKLAVLQALGRPLRGAVCTEVTEGEWLGEYPEALHEDLRWLATITPRAEAIAAKSLRSVRHGRRAIEAELRAVEAMRTEASTERRAVLDERVATLRRRLAHAPQPSEVKLERLRTKLRRRGGLELVRGTGALADDALREVLGKHLDIEASTPWILDERLLRLMVPLQKEPPATRRLARTLLRRRTEHGPWDLREHPANAAYLASLRERGIDPTPWIDGLPEMVVKSKGRRMHLRLEDDPLEVFHMGRHFGTCLSPGHCNFFSVFTNAADINKRVLFARDEEGTVIGRRLLCLTQEGAILPFHPYRHDDTWRFGPRSDAFVRRLAEAMGTCLVPHGSVPVLAADRWYDDGPVDVTGRHPQLQDGSDFRQALLEIPVEDAPGLVAATFGRTQLDEALAPMILALSELRERPELVVTLVPLVRQPSLLPTATCSTVGALLARVGALDVVRTRFADPIAHALEQSHRAHGVMDPTLLELLAQAVPGQALRLLRRTRGRGTRRWDDERQAERLLAASIAMSGLHRPAQALRLARLATQVSWYYADTKGRARRHLAELENGPTG